jgi:hypothetical protein
MTDRTLTTSSLFADSSSLPKITISARGGAPQLQAFVNAYVVGRQDTLMNGNWARPLYYLSLVAMHGQGTTLQGIFARLASTHSKDVSLEGIGDVVLAHHQSTIAESGYTLHWNFEQEEVLPTHDLHAVIECRMLTMFDPIQGLSGTRLQRGKRKKESLSLSTNTSRKVLNDLTERRNRERNPQFLLLVPGHQQGSQSFRQRLHFAFLDQRVPWPLDPAWADFLWDRGIKHKEIEAVKVWCYQPPVVQVDGSAVDGSAVDDLTPASAPFLAEAYFCRPKPALLLRDLQDALANRQISSLLPPSIVALPIVSRSRREERRIVLP